MVKHLGALTRPMSRSQRRHFSTVHLTAEPAPASRVRRVVARMGVLASVVAVVACGGGSDAPPSGALPEGPWAQSFAGTVSCDTLADATQSRAWETRVVFDRPVSPSGSTTSGASKASAVQVGGLAGSLAGGGRTRMTVTIPGPSIVPFFQGRALDFDVSADSASGTYRETGRWRIDVDAKGAVTLQGDSTAALDPVATGWRATCRWNLVAAEAPAGPVSYGHIEKLLAPPATVAPPGAFKNCGAGTFTVVTDGLYAGAAIVGFYGGTEIWAAALSLAAVGTTVSGQTAGALCPTAPLESTSNQLAILAAQIQQIDTYLGLATNVLYYDWYQLQLASASTAAYTWRQNVEGISPSTERGSGQFGNFMNPNGVGLWDYSLQPAQDAITDPAQLALDDGAFDRASNQVTSGSTLFQGYVNQLSGTGVVLPCSSDCSKNVIQEPGSALITLYKDLFSALQAKIDVYIPPAQEFNTIANQDIVPLYDQYNAMLVKFYTQAVYALQQALTMEWQVNEMNYFRATSTKYTTAPKQIGSWGGSVSPDTHYKYSNQSLELETKSYNTKQLNLAKLYTARLNQLYRNTLNYIVSDVPVAPQAYPDQPLSYTYTLNGVTQTVTEKPIDYAGQVGKNLPASMNGAQGRTPLSLVPAAADGPWKSAAVLYQFSGMRDVATCLSNLQAYNQAVGTAGSLQDWLQNNPGACPSIFTLADGTSLNARCDDSGQNCTGSKYDGNTLKPYTSFQKATGATGGPMVLAAQIVSNLKFCDPSKPALYWDKRGPMLNCGQWYVPKYLASGFPRANIPGANNDEDYWKVDSTYGYDYGIASDIVMNGDCSNNLQFGGTNNNDKYPAITTLIGDWSSGQPSSCEAVIPNVPLVNTSDLQTPSKIDMRTITGNYDTGDQTKGCSMGWFGSGIGNPLPKYDVYYNGGDEFQFGLRLPRGMNGGNEYGGYVLPLRVTAGCSSKNPMLRAYPRDTPLPNFSGDGYFCTQSTSAFTQPYFSCTVVDGTSYVFTLKNGNGNGTILEVRISP